MQIHLKAEKAPSLRRLLPGFLRLNRITLRNLVLCSSWLALKVTGGVATSQIGSRIDIVQVLQAAESES